MDKENMDWRPDKVTGFVENEMAINGYQRDLGSKTFGWYTIVGGCDSRARYFLEGTQNILDKKKIQEI